MKYSVAELSAFVRRYADEQGEEFDLRKNAQLVHFAMWVQEQKCEQAHVRRSALDFIKDFPRECMFFKSPSRFEKTLGVLAWLNLILIAVAIGKILLRHFA